MLRWRHLGETNQESSSVQPGDIFKNREFFYLSPKQSVAEAARYMIERNVGGRRGASTANESATRNTPEAKP